MSQLVLHQQVYDEEEEEEEVVVTVTIGWEMGRLLILL